MKILFYHILSMFSFVFVFSDQDVKIPPNEKKQEQKIVIKTTAEEINLILELSEEEKSVYQKALFDHSLTDAIRNEIINLLRRVEEPQLEDVLLKLLSDENESSRFKSFCIQHLGVSLLEERAVKSRDKILEKLYEILNKSDIIILRDEAYLALLEAKDKKTIQLIPQFLQKIDDHSLLKISIIYAFQNKMNDQLETIRSLLDHKDKGVRLTAIHYLGRWCDKGSEKKIMGLLNSEDRQIKEAAQLAIKLIKHDEKK